MAKTPIYLVTGFLGSGKTTFIKKALDFLSPSMKVAVVQNEFAESNLDGQELKRTTTADFDLLEINNGSVFCLCLLSGFTKSLSEFAKNYSADIILLEASGLSDPIAVGQIFNSPELQKEVYLAGNICVVDAKRFEQQKKLLPRVLHQIMVADHIIINKKDEVADLYLTEKETQKINPQGTKHTTCFCEVDFQSIFCLSSENKKQSLSFFFPENNKPDVKSAVHRSSKMIKAEKLSQFLEMATRDTWRMKGYLLLDNGKKVALQSVMGDYQTEEVEGNVHQTELVSLSPTLDAGTLKSIYQNFIA